MLEQRLSAGGPHAAQPRKAHHLNQKAAEWIKEESADAVTGLGELLGVAIDAKRPLDSHNLIEQMAVDALRKTGQHAADLAEAKGQPVADQISAANDAISAGLKVNAKDGS